jgi:hypothetical protein
MYLKNLKRLFGNPTKQEVANQTSTPETAENHYDTLQPRKRLVMAVGGAPSSHNNNNAASNRIIN